MMARSTAVPFRKKSVLTGREGVRHCDRVRIIDRGDAHLSLHRSILCDFGRVGEDRVAVVMREDFILESSEEKSSRVGLLGAVVMVCFTKDLLSDG